MTLGWPLFELRIRTPRLELRHVRESDLDGLAEALPDDLELDPSLPDFGLPDERRNRATRVYSGYWRSLGTWRPDDWCLRMLVLAEGRVAGVQTLEGTDFHDLRTLDTASYLHPWARGQGFGKEMRRAVLTLGFGSLGAHWAISSAWSDNGASIGVSRALGYEPNGVSLLQYRGRVGTQAHLRLSRERWLSSGLSAGIDCIGADACRPWFGLRTEPSAVES